MLVGLFCLFEHGSLTFGFRLVSNSGFGFGLVLV